MMITFNTYYESQEQLKEFIEKNSIKDSSQILCQLFTSQTNKKNLENILKDINSLLPKAKIIGTTTDGEIMDSQVSSQKTVLSISIFEKSRLEICRINNITNFYEAGKEIGNKLNKSDLKLIISFIEGLNGNGEDYIKALSKTTNNVKIAGGLAGDNSEFKNTFVFGNDKVLENGAVAIGIYSNDLIIHTDYSFDWVCVGKELTITKADKNVVYKIDNMSAYETYKYYLGDEIAQKLPEIGVEFPLVIQKSNMDVARAVLKNNNDGSLTFGGNFNVGDKVRFSYGYNDAILSNVEKNIKALMNLPVESIFIYSCMARKKFLKNSISLEIEPYSKIAKTSGFFSYGEFFTNCKSEFLNQTLTYVALSESNNVEKRLNKNIVLKNTNRSTLSALTHLINVTTNEILQQQKELEEASNAKDQFLANMSHELKTPLNSINIISSVMKKNKSGLLDEKSLKNLEIINKSGNYLLTLINDVLDISKLESKQINLNYEYFNAKDTFLDIYNMFLPQVKEKNINFNFYIDESIDTIYCDENKLKQVMKNLLSNAVKFVDKGSIYLNIKDSKTHISISVKDEGIGIEEEKLEHIFDRFKQADSSTAKKYGGTGLGLAICKEILNLLKGTIFVKSKLNMGTTFIVNIPKDLNSVTDTTAIIKKSKEDALTKNSSCDLSEDDKKRVLVYNTCALEFFNLVIKLKRDFSVIQVFKKSELFALTNEKIDNIIVDIDTIEKEELDEIINLFSNNLILLSSDSKLVVPEGLNIRVVEKNKFDELKKVLR